MLMWLPYMTELAAGYVFFKYSSLYTELIYTCKKYGMGV